MDFGISHSGRRDILSHLKTEKHCTKAQLHTVKARPITQHFPSSEESTTGPVIQAEVRFCQFVAENNLSFRVAESFQKFLKVAFPDSDVARKFSCSRTKTQCVITGALAPAQLEKVVSFCKAHPFSLMVDESNDRADDKQFAVMVRYFDTTRDCSPVVTKLLGLPLCNIATADALFQELNESLISNELSWENVLSFTSDTCNTMKGRRGGLISLIHRRGSPLILDVGCVNHLGNLAVKAGLKEVLFDVDQLLVDIFYHFTNSTKRKEQFKSLSRELYAIEPKPLLKHCPTRWLSLIRCIKRLLEQWDLVFSYFKSHSDVEKRGSRPQQICRILEKPFTKALLQFLSHTLPALDTFNETFQNTSESTVSFLVQEVHTLIRAWFVNFVKPEIISAGGPDASQIEFTLRDNQLDDEFLHIGDSTWLTVAEIEEEHEKVSFYRSVRNFYVKVADKLLKKLPLNHPVFTNMAFLNPALRETVSAEAVKTLATRFPAAGVHDKLDELSCEVGVYSVDPLLPKVSYYKAADEMMRPKLGDFWLAMEQLKSVITGRLRYPLLTTLAKALLTIPVSNADPERLFSMVRKIDTDQRADLKPQTVESLLLCKVNTDSMAHEMELPNKLLKKAKKATKEYNLAHKKD